MNTFDYICVGVARTIAAAGKFTAAAAVACCHGLAYGFAAAKNILECCVSKCERLFAWAIILTIV